MAAENTGAEWFTSRMTGGGVLADHGNLVRDGVPRRVPTANTVAAGVR